MSRNFKIKASKHVDKLLEYVRVFREERGFTIDETGSRIPNTTYQDVDQVILDILKDYNRAHEKQPKHDHEVHAYFWTAIRTFRQQKKEAPDPNAVYPDNQWIWFDVLKKVVFHLDHDLDPMTPDQSELIISSITEAFDDRVDDVAKILDKTKSTASAVASGIGKAANIVTDAGGNLWRNIKIVSVVGLSLVGVAIVAPPVIRAVRETRPPQLEEG